MGSDSLHPNSARSRSRMVGGVASLILMAITLASVYFYVYLPYWSSVTLDSTQEESAGYRKVKISNAFPFPISIFVEDQQEYGVDSVLGNYLDDLGPSTTIDILVLNGHRIFATEVNGLKRIQTKKIVENQNAYVFGESVKKAPKSQSEKRGPVVTETLRPKSAPIPKQQTRTATRNMQIKPGVIHEELPTEDPADAQEVRELMSLNAVNAKKSSNLRPSLNLEYAKMGGVRILKNAFGKEFKLPITDARKTIVAEYQRESMHEENMQLARSALDRLKAHKNYETKNVPGKEISGQKSFIAKHSHEQEFRDTLPNHHEEEKKTDGDFGYMHPVRRKDVSVEINVGWNEGMHPAVKLLGGSPSTSVQVKFLSLSPRKLTIWFDNGKGGIFEGKISLGQVTTTNSYEGHVFYFTVDEKTMFGADSKGPEVARVHIHKGKELYVIRDPDHPAPADIESQAKREEEYITEYQKRTGVLWRHFFGPSGPRPPPSLYMWPADKVGQVHRVKSSEGFWQCKGDAGKCQSKDPVDLELEVISLEPRAFVIKDFFSDFEVNWVIDTARPRLSGSQVGGAETGILQSDTRTSTNTWLPRTTNQITETLYMRAADLLQLDEKILTMQGAAEEIQVVHYDVGQKYDAHHDWGVDGHPESRYITLLIYLNDMQDENAGGETSFPKAKIPGNTKEGIKVHPGKGSAVLFYNLLPDGNGDDLALHAALPVKKGEKWLCNFWVWDPTKNKS